MVTASVALFSYSFWDLDTGGPGREQWHRTGEGPARPGQ